MNYATTIKLFNIYIDRIISNAVYYDIYDENIRNKWFELYKLSLILYSNIILQDPLFYLFNEIFT
jgi:hypothetical protein